jgi:hypothetical protein
MLQTYIQVDRSTNFNEHLECSLQKVMVTDVTRCSLFFDAGLVVSWHNLKQNRMASHWIKNVERCEKSDIDVRKITSCRQHTCIKRHQDKCSTTSIAARDFQDKSHTSRCWNKKMFSKIRKQYKYIVENHYNTLIKLTMHAKYICFAHKKLKLSYFSTAMHSVRYLIAIISLSLAKEN